MQEQQYQINVYNLLQKLVYFMVAIDCFILFYAHANIHIFSDVLLHLKRVPILMTPERAKISTLFLVTLVAVGTRAKKNKALNIYKSIVLPILGGLILVLIALYLTKVPQFAKSTTGIIPFLTNSQLEYALFSFIGVFLVQMGADNISKIIKDHLGKDRWNTDEESFDQNTKLINTPTSINLPYLFRSRRKLHKGWININPFRGTMVIGTPGSGKSFGVIDPAIRQMIAKGFCLCIYDFKFPDLAQIAYLHYLKKKSKDSKYNYRFSVINLDDVRLSNRVNPFKKEYIRSLADAQEMAEAMVSSLQKGGGSGGGSEQFFTQSAVNFLSSCIYFFATYQDGKYSDLPHILSFINRSYQEIFDTLFSEVELESLLSPFRSAYENRAFDQLEGQVGTLKIFISRLATKESFWVFSGDDINLKITDPKHPTIMILASDPKTQDINSALYSAVLNRTLRLINSKKNLPGGIIADEFPTIYIHKIDNVVATARSNKIAVLLGLQELPQLRQFYKRDVAETITSIIGNVLSGSARDKNTLDWLEKMFGKIKQRSFSESISQQGTTTSTNERMQSLIPAGKIAALQTGEMVGIIARDQNNDILNYKTSVINGKISLDLNKIKKEEKSYKPIPPNYSFIDPSGTDRTTEILMRNFRKINEEVTSIIQSQMEKAEK